MNPTQLGPYEIKSRLGRGGMGAVYEAVDVFTGDTVAVKVLAAHLADNVGLRSRFDAEIDALKNLRHPGIVRLIAFGEQDDQPFFAMELVRGRSLEQILRAGRRFTWRETVAIAVEITGALKAAHDNGIVHRDLKPANLLVPDAPPATEAAAGESSARRAAGQATSRADRADRPVTVKLADFGIAKLFGGAGQTALGNVVGTAEYMAPEQASGRPIDHRVDLYSLGLVMFAMLTGGPPFRGTQLTEVIDKQRRAIPPRVSSVVPDVPPELDELIARLLSKEPAQRPASALALGRLLTAIETLHSTPTTSASTAGTAAAPPIGSAAAPDPSPAGSIEPGPTRQERSSRATRPAGDGAVPGPDLPAQTAAVQAGSPRKGNPDLDLLGPTQAMPSAAARPARPTRGTADHRVATPTAGSTAVTQDLNGPTGPPRPAATAPPSRLSTDVASAVTQVDHSDRNRFTTVAEFERQAADKARREQRWQMLWQGISAAVIVASLLGGGWLLLKPLSADQLHARIMAVADAPHGDLRDVRADMETFLAAHADDPRAGRIRELKRTLDLDILERRARRRSRGDKDLTPLERDYRAAMTNEENGPSACLRELDAMLAVHASTPTGDADDAAALWLELARRKVEQLRPRAAAEQQDDARRIGELLGEAASLAARAEVANDDAARRAFATQRRSILGTIVDMYAKRPHAADAVAYATRELALAGDGGSSPAVTAAPPVIPKATTSAVDPTPVPAAPSGAE